MNEIKNTITDLNNKYNHNFIIYRELLNIKWKNLNSYFLICNICKIITIIELKNNNYYRIIGDNIISCNEQMIKNIIE